MPKYINFDDDEMFEDYAAEYDPEYTGQLLRKSKKKKVQHTPKKTEKEIIAELADETGIAAGFDVTYKPSKHERGWLLESLEGFFYLDLITDVEAQVKGGKEASVYRCAAHDTIKGHQYLAAKVYRPRIFRQIRNDAMYRQGREAIGENGKTINAKDWRALKAMNQGGNMGQAMSHTSWLMYEYTTLDTLRKAGASVPEVFSTTSNAILMSYHGDENLPAPTLNEVRLHPEEVAPLFEEAMNNLNIILQHGLIHGDLSAFNILYDAGKLVLIDFPQVVDIEGNPHARKILTRDVVRVCEYFQSYGMTIDVQGIINRLWEAHGTPEANQEEVLVNILEAVDYSEIDDED